MNIVFSALICFIPLIAVFLIFVFLLKDFKVTQGLLSCLLGLFAVLPIASFQFFIGQDNFLKVSTLQGVLLQALVLNGLVEESIKMALLLLLPAKKMSQKNFFWCAVLSGLALGCFESLIYLISGYENIGLRMITAVVIHISCAGLSGLFIYDLRAKKHFNITPYIFAVLFHGVYNYFAGFSSNIRYFSIAVIVLAIVECRVRYVRVRDGKEEVQVN